MALRVAQQYKDKYSAAAASETMVYVRVTKVAVDLLKGVGSISLCIWLDAAARDANAEPISIVDVNVYSEAQDIPEVRHPETGNVIVPAYRIPALSELLAQADIASGFDSVRAGLYTSLKATHPLLKNATDV